MFNIRPLRPAIAAGLLMLALTSLAFSGGPVFWEISKQEDVVKGDARGVSIAETGAIMLAPAYTLVYDTKEAYIWSSAADSAGNIYLGTGHEGRIFKVDPTGAGKLLYDAGELDVYAMTTDQQGNLYAATSPDGQIYKITPDGRASGFYDPPDKYIWSLAFDPASGTLYAGTGDKGVIYKIDPQGKAAVFADTNENNIVSMILDRGNLIAGTDPAGLVLRISPDGKVFALFDSPMQEIHSLSLAQDGSIMALGINAQSQRQSTVGVSSTSSLSSEGVITLSTDDQDQATVVSASDNSSSQRGRSRIENAKGALFRIRADGSSEVRWSATDSIGFALRLLSDGQMLVGTNNKGRIYSISSARAQTLLIQSPEDQTSTFLTAGGNVYATSSNLGRLYRIGRETVSEGTYTSPVRDTRFAGQWGAINWRASGAVEIQTRTGNTETPDATWSDWSAPYRNAQGDQVTSPSARFIQWRATLRSTSTARGKTTSEKAAHLQSVAIAYLPRNQAPEISSLAVFPAGVAMQEMPLAVDPSVASSGLDPQIFGIISNVPPRRYYQKGARTLVWQATDANDDTLVYKIFYRTVEEENWHLLADSIAQSYYTIDASRLPDGAYNFKVEASDSPSNPADMAMVGEEMTDAVELDNTPPSIKVTGPSVTGQTAEVTFDVSDATGRVIRGEYSLDGGPWMLVFPTDGISDSARESFRVKVNLNAPGAHTIAFRCADSSLNVGTSKVQAVR
ncbi:MAG TPA: hypothetical protein VID27_15200 [Blastocatellia bacterium]